LTAERLESTLRSREIHPRVLVEISPPSGSVSGAQVPADAARRMKVKLQTEEGKEIYRQRKKIVGPVFGQVKFNLLMKQE